MKYCLFIDPHSCKSSAVQHAQDLTIALLAQKQQVKLFFYGYAVETAFNKDNSWKKLANKGILLHVCSTIAENHLKRGQQVNAYFSLAGLGIWMDTVLESDIYLEIR